MSCVRSWLFSKGYREEMFWGHHFHQSLMCQYAWQGVVDVFMPQTHTYINTSLSFTHKVSYTLSFTYSYTHISLMLCEQLKCHCSRRKAWIILSVLMFSIIVNPPGMVYSCPLPSLSNSCTHPSVSHVILPPINAGHDCSTFIGPCGVHSSQRFFGLCYRL